MPVAFRDIVDDARVLFLSADVRHHNAALYLTGCAGQIEVQNWAGAGTQMRLAANELNELKWTQSHWPDPNTCYVSDALYWIDDNWSVGNGIDMDAILNTMLVADFDQLQKFVGIVDAYRVAIWNAPFNANFYAALARGFEKWP
ncbi:hypothetical protein ES705_16315 [subsurface metagenome]